MDFVAKCHLVQVAVWDYLPCMIREWKNPKDYLFTTGLSPDQWAWEFLRRNPDYQREWSVFWDIWQALEADYGSPPKRNYPAWKQDPRAFVVVGEGGEGDCRIEHDKVLIECHLGARWGFHKFPPDPEMDDPAGEGRLSWRRVPLEAKLVDREDLSYLGSEPGKIALGFDLDRPLREQMERAKRFLQITQRQRIRQGSVKMVDVSLLKAEWTTFLRLLDGEANGADSELLGRRLGIGDVDSALSAARAMSRDGYRQIPQLSS